MQYLRTLQVQVDLMQEYGGEVEQNLHGYSSKITEGDIRKYRCNLCGKISRDKTTSFRHVEDIHFPGSFEYQCDQCDQKFDTKTKWYGHKVHCNKVSK